MTNSKEKTKATKKTTQRKNYPKIQKVELTTLEVKNKKQELKQEIEREKGTNFVLTVLGIIILCVIAILIFTLTYAYFTATIKEIHGDRPDAQVISADLLVKYEDGKSNIEIGKKIEPGDTLTKDFSIKNEGNDTGMYTIILENINHNLGHKEIVENNEVLFSDIAYKLIKIDNEDPTIETVIATGTLPFNSGEKENAFIIYTKDEVLVKSTNYYRLELTYINLDLDQSDSMGEKLELKVNIAEYDGEFRTDSTEY